MIKFKNNFERDTWYNWYERYLLDPATGFPKEGISPTSAAVKADQVLAELQSRREEDKVPQSRPKN